MGLKRIPNRNVKRRSHMQIDTVRIVMCLCAIIQVAGSSQRLPVSSCGPSRTKLCSLLETCTVPRSTLRVLYTGVNPFP